MTEASYSEPSFNAVAAERLHGARDSSTQSTSEELAEIVVTRVHVERATGLLMQVYDLDADNALELLKWWSQSTKVEMWVLAGRLHDELADLARDRPYALPSACDALLFDRRRDSEHVVGEGVKVPHD